MRKYAGEVAASGREWEDSMVDEMMERGERDGRKGIIPSRAKSRQKLVRKSLFFQVQILATVTRRSVRRRPMT